MPSIDLQDTHSLQRVWCYFKLLPQQLKHFALRYPHDMPHMHMKRSIVDKNNFDALTRNLVGIHHTLPAIIRRCTDSPFRSTGLLHHCTLQHSLDRTGSNYYPHNRGTFLGRKGPGRRVGMWVERDAEGVVWLGGCNQETHWIHNVFPMFP